MLDTRYIVYWNHAAGSLFGYAREEVLERATEFLCADGATFQLLYGQGALIIQERSYWRAESCFPRRDGSSFLGRSNVDDVRIQR